METLSEEQVQRYSRAILLPGVGGHGQKALLATGVRLTAGGPALLTAAAYLAAGGTPVAGPPGLLAAEDVGFLIAESEIGRPAEACVQRALFALNPDATKPMLREGTLAALPLAERVARPLVAVGRRGGEWVVWAASEEACAGCLFEVVRGAEAPGPGPEAPQAGTWAALLFQRLVLGFAPPLSGVRLAEDGNLTLLAAPPCPHGSALPVGLWGEVLRHLEACFPEEGCGVVLLGPGGARWVPLSNAYAAWAAKDAAAFPRNARTAFLFEPKAWLALLKEADAGKERVAYVVHSHPDGQAHFSAEDVAQAAPEGLPLLPGVSYLVVAVLGGRAAQACCAWWKPGGFQQMPFRLAG